MSQWKNNRTMQLFSTSTTTSPPTKTEDERTSNEENEEEPVMRGVPREEMPFVHFWKNEKPKLKFKSPRKLASKLFHELNVEAVENSKDANPNVLKVPFRVGDAVEMELISGGGVNSKEIDKVRGIVIGRVNRGLGSSIHIRDVLFGQPVERKIPLHSPLLKSLKVIEPNFLHKGKKRVKRAKLYYLRDRNPIESRVTK
jgi:large subunit ribosomal protein L19